MSYFNLQSFKFGLDARKTEQSSQPGTLVTLENAHVNQGGEISKRFRFVQFTSADLLTTFGMKFTSQGAVVFGSSATPATLTAWPAFGTPAGFTFPISYMRLQHPDGATAMTAIRTCCVFADIPFGVAEFADGNVYPFYNGLIVTDFIAGLVIESMKTAGVVDNAKIATALAALVNASSNYTGTASSLFVDIANKDFYSSDGLASLQTALGTLTVLPDAQGTQPIVGSSAIGGFSIFAGSNAGGSISSVKVNSEELLDAPVSFTNDINATALLVAQAINKSGQATARTAVANGNIISIYAKPGTASTNYTSDNDFVVQTTVSGAFIVGDYSALITGTGFVVQLKVGPSAGETSIMSKPSWGVPVFSVNISSITHAGATNTVNCSASHNLQTGDQVTIAGCTNPLNNGTFTVTRTSATQFTVANATGVAQPGAAGTVTLNTSYASIALMLAAMVTDINANSATYNAYTDGSTIYLGRKVSSSSDNFNNDHVLWSTTLAGTFNASPQGGGALQAIAVPISVSCTGGSSNNPYATSQLVSCKAVSGTAPYVFSWQFQSGNAFIVPTSPNSSSTAFRVPITAPKGSAIYKCIIADTSTPSQQSSTQNVTIAWNGIGFTF